MAKQQAWEVEKEVRHVTIVHPDANIQPSERQAGGKAIRYLPVMLRDGGRRIAFAEIVIGPKQDAKVTRERLVGILTQTGYTIGAPEYPEITASALASMET